MLTGKDYYKRFTENSVHYRYHRSLDHLIITLNIPLLGIYDFTGDITEKYSVHHYRYKICIELNIHDIVSLLKALKTIVFIFM